MTEKSNVDLSTAYMCLRNYIISNPKGVDFLDIEVFFDKIGFDYRGSNRLGLRHNKSVIIWCGWNLDAIKVLEAIMKSDFKLKATPAILYNLKGYISKLPVVYSGLNTKYDTYHWAPMRIVSNES